MASVFQNATVTTASCSKRSVSVASCAFSAPKSINARQIVLTDKVCKPSSTSVRQNRAASVVAKATYTGSLLSAPEIKYAIVVAQFNSLITKGLLEGCKESFSTRGVPAEDVDVFWVPGAFELPVIAKTLADSRKYGAVVCLGAVIRGATSHYDAVVGAATNGILNAGVNSGVPVVFGVLTCDTLEQALDRTGGKLGNKGAEFAAVAVEMSSLVGQIKTGAGKAKAAP